MLAFIFCHNPPRDSVLLWSFDLLRVVGEALGAKISFLFMSLTRCSLVKAEKTEADEPQVPSQTNIACDPLHTNPVLDFGE
jgi:hypothetical protein